VEQVPRKTRNEHEVLLLLDKTDYYPLDGRSVAYTKPRPKGDYRWVPDTSGIYRLYQGERVVYVGLTSNLRERLLAHDRQTPYWGSYDYKSTRGINTRVRRSMEKRALKYNRPTRNVRR
jgi:hypothetical protein